MLDALRDVPGSWAHLIVEDVSWMSDRINVARQMRPVGNASWWIHIARTDRALWTSWCREAERSASAEHLALSEVAVWHGDLHEICVRGQLPVPSILKPAASQLVYPCRECDRIFNSKVAWSRHRTLAHPEFDLAGRLGVGTCCHACGLDFGRRSRLLRHLRFGAQHCLAQLAHHLQPIPVEQVLELRADDAREARAARMRGECQNYAAAPPERFIGPTLGGEVDPIVIRATTEGVERAQLQAESRQEHAGVPSAADLDEIFSSSF